MGNDNGYQPNSGIENQIGMLFQKLTKYKSGVPQTKPDTHQNKGLGILPLPNNPLPTSASLVRCIQQRRSCRDYNKTPISLDSLSELIWSTAGITSQKGDQFLRSAPSAGGLYPIETLTALFNVDGAPKGIARYIDAQHALEWVKFGDFQQQFYDACIQQDMIFNCAILFLWVADLSRCVWRYGQRSYRYIYLDAGHMAQNLALTATSMGIGCCAIGAFLDDHMDYLCNIDGENKTVIYASAVGNLNKQDNHFNINY